MIRTIFPLGLAVMLSASACAAPVTSGVAARGERLFKELKCVTCHSVDGAGGKSAPALGHRGQGYTPNTMAGAMWSHATVMWKAMDTAGVPRPRITAQQAADLFTYFAGGPGSDKPGDPKRGQGIYEAKFCFSCHDMPDTGAPRLGAQQGRLTAFSMVASLWQHGSGMLSQMVAKNKEWQTLTAEEMGHILAYLNTRK